MFQLHRLTWLVIGSLTLAVTLASAQPREVVRSEITLRGTVEAIDRIARTIRIRGDQGNIVTFDVPQSVARFDQIRIGDVITMAYYDRVNLRPKPAGEAPVDRSEAAVTTTAPDALPGATVAVQRVATVTVTGWDPATRTVTYTGPLGTSYSRRLLDTIDPSIVAGLKVGDRVDVTWTEAVRVSIESGPASAQGGGPSSWLPTWEELRHRLTFFVQWGPDNSFSGQVIKQADGQTPAGVPIHLNETSYDDIYGRMGLFKIGVGYRISPRNEAIFNVQWSRSSSEITDIGTAGTVGVRLLVNFDDYNYWGFEGGQRFYFSRAGYTPYAGYLVGLNHNGNIRGTFVNVPLNATPDLAAQDGIFFNAGWAFSFGPTAGVLVPLGPVEVFAETQLRFMSGLSDVNWLVDDGLKDINTESSRWSIPILFGARLRF
jgi:hypothetical protein